MPEQKSNKHKLALKELRRFIIPIQIFLHYGLDLRFVWNAIVLLPDRFIAIFALLMAFFLAVRGETITLWSINRNFDIQIPGMTGNILILFLIALAVLASYLSAFLTRRNPKQFALIASTSRSFDKVYRSACLEAMCVLKKTVGVKTKNIEKQLQQARVNIAIYNELERVCAKMLALEPRLIGDYVSAFSPSLLRSRLRKKQLNITSEINRNKISDDIRETCQDSFICRLQSWLKANMPKTKNEVDNNEKSLEGSHRTQNQAIDEYLSGVVLNVFDRFKNRIDYNSVVPLFRIRSTTASIYVLNSLLECQKPTGDDFDALMGIQEANGRGVALNRLITLTILSLHENKADADVVRTRLEYLATGDIKNQDHIKGWMHTTNELAYAQRQKVVTNFNDKLINWAEHESYDLENDTIYLVTQDNSRAVRDILKAILVKDGYKNFRVVMLVDGDPSADYGSRLLQHQLIHEFPDGNGRLNRIYRMSKSALISCLCPSDIVLMIMGTERIVSTREACSIYPPSLGEGFFDQFERGERRRVVQFFVGGSFKYPTEMYIDTLADEALRQALHKARNKNRQEGLYHWKDCHVIDSGPIPEKVLI